ncbi:Beta-xylosidase [Pseudobythopirellula maris]|uniref:Beta-xylosidase n=1 Tax=Pseudobythopirellula maris TaxID=2527991 RepID=A0A5C5ZMU7_9BACT|nr:glycoside hydrolase 43 family protein [Pseudobythopirellula maris]TWT88181.1 Beta-xylosidase [Pseudobythopirellula maris]
MPATPRLLLRVTVLLCLLTGPSLAEPWVADPGDGTYRNPVLFADYSDPDVVRVGDDFYMTASSFSCVPGLPILHSRDLVEWELIGHAVDRLPERFNQPQHGNGIWAPSIRHHDGWFWIFVGDPDWGILMTKSKSPTGPWSPLHVVKEGKGLIDPCPLWDDDGRAYLVHAYANSRSGRKSIIVAREMAPDGSRLIGEEHLVIDGRNDVHPTIEGPKFYKRDGWYYILAPAGGVKPGWQLAARSKAPLGPYEVRRVLEQGTTDINGPHQGGWVSLENGEDWFLHFQDRGAYGRIVHLNPVRWVDGWPEMGVDLDGNGVGEPVETHAAPGVGADWSVADPQTSDDFDGPLGLQWQWHGNPAPDWGSVTERPGWLRLHGVEPPAGDLTEVVTQLLQKFAAPAFSATTRLEFSPAADGSSTAGLVVLGLEHAAIVVRKDDEGLRIEQFSNKVAGAGGEDRVHGSVALDPSPAEQAAVWLRVNVEPGALCRFSYSTDGESYHDLGQPFHATPGRWIGAKVGLFCLGKNAQADFDWFEVE